MSLNNCTLESTKEYSLSEIFSTNDRKIIIPDFQRDYCWGDKNHGQKQDSDIVPSFLETLKEESKSGVTLLGKIDVYENPKNHIYLTDGQQRLTTLYLLIGMLYKKTGMIELKQCLISDYEEIQDDKEPYLQYAIRESSLFFLTDLVNEFFIAEVNHSVEKIENQPWFFNEYKFDPTIISMLKALTIIEKDFNNWNDFDFKTFSTFILNDVKIQYYDVQDRKHGEERFVIINTTGKSLEQSETLKPILLGKVNDSVFSEQWEERETWFWRNRNKKEKELIADSGVEDFLYWCFRIIGTKESVSLIKDTKELFKDGESKIIDNLKAIDRLFVSLKYLLIQLKDAEIQNQFKFINKAKEVSSIIDLRNLESDRQQNILLPLLAYISKFNPDKQIVVSFLRRLRKNYFDKEWFERKQNYVDWRHILQIIEKSSSAEDVLTFSNPIIEEFRVLPKSNITNWYNDEEKIKANLKVCNKNKIEEWEDNLDFMGDITFLLKAHILNEGSLDTTLLDSMIFDINLLDQIYINYESTIDLIRSEDIAKSNPKLANLFRLFRLFIGCNKVDHISRVTWEIEGVLFSTLNRKHLFKPEFIGLVRSSDLAQYCQEFIVRKVKEERIFEIENNQFTVDKFIKSWLVLKVFNANENNALLCFYDGYETGVAAYMDKDKNKLIQNVEFSLENSICGFAVKCGGGGGNYVHYTGVNGWLQPNIIDTPFSDVKLNDNERTQDQLNGNKKVIRGIIDRYFSL